MIEKSGRPHRRNRKVRLRALAVVVATAIASILILSATPPLAGASNLSGGSRSAQIGTAVVASSGGQRVLNCSLPISLESPVTYDPADHYLYANTLLKFGSYGIAVVKTPCTLVKLIRLPSYGPFISAMVYDPLTEEVVAVSNEAFGSIHSYAYVLQGTSLVKTVDFGNRGHYSIAWDPGLAALLLAGYCNANIDVLYLTEVNGVTKAAVMLNVFDQNNCPINILVADKYVFVVRMPGANSNLNYVDVFDYRTLAYFGNFSISAPGLIGSMIWDPLNQTVVVGLVYFYGLSAPRTVFFLNVSSVATRTFTFHALPVHDILRYGAAALAYSPADQSVYISSWGGDDVWILGSSGSFNHVYLKGALTHLFAMIYDSAFGAMCVIGDSGDLYLISP